MPAPLTFALPPGASELREPYVPPAPQASDFPEGDLIDAVYLARSAVARAEDAMSRAHACEAEDYRVDVAHLEAIESAATALNAATAVYRARREMP
jgi:hypothetical protein